MHGSPGMGGRRRTGRSAEQQEGSAAFTYVMKAWEDLSDEERLAWNVQGSNRRSHGINYFKTVNLRRARRGEELTRLPPPSKPYEPKPILKRLVIRNRGDRITLMLELRRVPTVPTTVWGARPCNRGLARPDKCPRLGWLMVSADVIIDITALYFKKHGAHIQQHGVELVGKRVFIRTREEMDEGANLFEEVQAVIPPPERPRRKGQKPPFPS
jgi:hypothetical protein